MNKACSELFQRNKIPEDDDVRDTIYSALEESHAEKIEKINSSKGGWTKYWTEVVQKQVN
jgi:hypothetical protein